MRIAAAALWALGATVGLASTTPAQVRTAADCAVFFNDGYGPHVRNTCANVNITVLWRISGGRGCLSKGADKATVSSGDIVATPNIGPNCEIDFWACDHAELQRGTCKLPVFQQDDRDEDDINLRRRKLEAERDERDRANRTAAAEAEARAAAAYREEVEREERLAREREAEEEAQRQTGQALLEGVGAVLQGLSAANSGSQQSYTPPAPAAPAYVPPPQEPVATGSIVGRSQAVTPRYTGSASHGSDGCEVDVANGRPRGRCGD